MPVKVVYCFKMEGTGRKPYGWTEVHMLLATPIALSTSYPAAIALGNLRNRLNGENVFLTKMRLSVPGAFRRSRPYFSDMGGNSTSDLVAQGGVKGKMADIPNTSLQLLVSANDQQKANVYMAGIPDDIITTDPAGPRFTGVGGYLNRFNAFKTELTNGQWGFRSRTPPVTVPILGWANEAAAPFRLILTIAQAQDFAALGDVVHVRGVRPFTPRQRMAIGQYRVVAKVVAGGSASYTLAGTQGYASGDILSPGTVESVTYAYPAITEVQISNQTSRKRGVGTDRPRGRSSPRRRSAV